MPKIDQPMYVVKILRSFQNQIEQQFFLAEKNDPKKRDFKAIHIIYLIGLLSNGKCAI